MPPRVHYLHGSKEHANKGEHMNQHEEDAAHIKQSWMAVAKRLGGFTAAALVGGLISWGITHVYSVESSKELKEEAAKLRQLNLIMLNGMEDAGLMTQSRDAAGQPTGIVIKLGGSGQAEAHSAATLSPSKPAP